MCMGKTYYKHELQLPISHKEMLHFVSSIPAVCMRSARSVIIVAVLTVSSSDIKAKTEQAERNEI